jgi:hypothetical protein
MKTINEAAGDYANNPAMVTKSIEAAFIDGVNEMRKRSIEAFKVVIRNLNLYRTEEMNAINDFIITIDR